MYVAPTNGSRGAFYALSPSGDVARWSSSATRWVSDNRGRIGQALLDASPSLIQGASSFMSGQAATITKGVGIAAQAGVAAKEYYDQYQQYRSGGHIDPMQIATSTGRMVSAAMNTYGAVGDQDAAATQMIDGGGTWVAGAATAADAVHHAHTDPGRTAQDPGYEMYGMHRNPMLGDQPGQYPPGYDPRAAPAPSSRSSQSLYTHPNDGNENLASTLQDLSLSGQPRASTGESAGLSERAAGKRRATTVQSPLGQDSAEAFSPDRPRKHGSSSKDAAKKHGSSSKDAAKKHGASTPSKPPKSSAEKKAAEKKQHATR
ncbi:hypothetical protein [Streptomyces antibioticus]|uniref:hypothetical protein n=1 Tax=Streptomyces antibioticus TaxID=1890 RepID=UPI0033B36BE7